MKNQLLTLILMGTLTITLLASSCQSSQPEMEELTPARTILTVTQNTELDWYGPSGMRWGVGFDSIVMNVCSGALDLDYDNMDNELISQGNWDTTFTLTVIKSQKELRTTLGVASNTALDIGVYKASAEGKYAKQQVKNAYSVYAVVAVDVIGPTYTIKEDRIKLTKKARELFESNYAEFQKIYGDQYLQTISTGGMFRGIIEIRTTSRAAQTQVYTKVAGKGGAISLGGDVSKTKDYISSDYALTVTVFQRSGDATKSIPVTLDEMIDRATNFEGDVVRGDWRTCATKATFQDYPLTVSGTALSQKRAIRELTGYYDEFNTLLYDLQFINSHQLWYTEAADWSIKLNNGKTYTLQSLSDHIEKNILGDILDVAEYCAENSLESVDRVAEADFGGKYSIIYDNLPAMDNYFPKQAKDLRDMYSAVGDGEYILYYQGNKNQPYQVWVKGMRGNEPKEYITVPPGNYSSIPSDKTYYRWQSGKAMKTTYDRIRINPLTLVVDIHDSTYSTTTGGPISFYPWSKKPVKKRTKTETWTFSNYGATKNCNGKEDNNKSIARVDLRGTPFAVAEDVKWEIGGHNADNKGYARLSWENQVVTIKASNGSSGWAKPSPELRLQYKPE